MTGGRSSTKDRKTFQQPDDHGEPQDHYSWWGSAYNRDENGQNCPGYRILTIQS
jgi:hypothetical protein